MRSLPAKAKRLDASDDDFHVGEVRHMGDPGAYEFAVSGGTFERIGGVLPWLVNVRVYKNLDVVGDVGYGLPPPGVVACALGGR